MITEADLTPGRYYWITWKEQDRDEVSPEIAQYDRDGIWFLMGSDVVLYRFSPRLEWIEVHKVVEEFVRGTTEG